ncbi:hypothetical protein [Paenibacillus macquariensis]|uniref:Uncharacterized protein n=1 Tax=Paenibacillus macquariensis TaxID=948756 RepID=A0ABY1KBG8_9BACL|nr:hypothetical protein [Paenibacillus macquariensis]MEC0094257.1 hypothetical protein [Paenibacillus macquariensis]OAB32150.1 hypothetical protein PMSM_17980 [Paenibacillus macquariensis subsp. macquariensis]SIR55244.1 hypothetical protein SAMN05421578_11861 [Paenibacillus macquariensis]
MRRPLGVSLISFFYFFGAILLLFTSVFYDANADAIGIAERFGVPNAPEQLVRILVAGLSLVMVYGYRNLKQWGFWLMIIYSILFGMVSLTLATTYTAQPFIGNMIWSIIVLTYSIYVKEAFFQQNA